MLEYENPINCNVRITVTRKTEYYRGIGLENGKRNPELHALAADGGVSTTVRSTGVAAPSFVSFKHTQRVDPLPPSPPPPFPPTGPGPRDVHVAAP
jgi:hypothetical protein